MFMKPSKCTGFIMGHTWHKYKMIYLSGLKKTQQSWTPEELCSVKYNMSQAELTLNNRHALTYKMRIPVLRTYFFHESSTKFSCLIPIFAILNNRNVLLKLCLMSVS